MHLVPARAIVAALFLATLGHAQTPVPGSDAQATQTTAAQPPFPHEPTALDTQIRTILADPAAARAHWGIAVTALDGTPVYGLDEAKLFRPASTAKLFTTAAAMSLLGPDTRFTTNIYGRLDVASGIVQGNLVILGAGDPNFGTTNLQHTSPTPNTTPTDLQELAAQLKAKGVVSVHGKIIGDDQLFAQEPPPPGWAAEDLVWGYGALPSALSFSDNQLRLTIRAHRATSPHTAKTNTAASVELDQLVPYLHISNNTAVEPPEPGQIDIIDVQSIAGRPNTLNVLGSLSPTAAPITEHVAIPDPAQYTAEALRSLLLQQNIRVTGNALASHYTSAIAHPFLASLRAPADCETSVLNGTDCTTDCLTTPHADQVLAQHISAPLADDVVFTLKTSANLHAELLLRQLAAKGTCGGATDLQGARILRAWLLKAGLADTDITLYDGSGLSTKDLVTPRAETHLLAYATTQPWFAAWKSALPVAGVDGTLAARFTNSPLKGKLFAKTGTLGESRALAGYVLCASGQQLAFAILVDNHDPGSSADRTAMDKIVEAIAATN